MMPLFSGAFLLHACRTDSGGALRREEGFSSRVKFKGADSNKGSNKVHTSRLVLLAVLVGFAFGVMRAISLSAGGGAATDVTLATVCGVLGGGVLLLVTALFTAGKMSCIWHVKCRSRSLQWVFSCSPNSSMVLSSRFSFSQLDTAISIIRFGCFVQNRQGLPRQCIDQKRSLQADCSRFLEVH